jgi:hypothetical protein
MEESRADQVPTGGAGAMCSCVGECGLIVQRCSCVRCAVRADRQTGRRWDEERRDERGERERKGVSGVGVGEAVGREEETFRVDLLIPHQQTIAHSTAPSTSTHSSPYPVRHEVKRHLHPFLFWTSQHYSRQPSPVSLCIWDACAAGGACCTRALGQARRSADCWVECV